MWFCRQRRRERGARATVGSIAVGMIAYAHSSPLAFPEGSERAIEAPATRPTLVQVPHGANQEPPWSQRFPGIALRIPHFDARMDCEEARVRLRVLTELTYFRRRDSKLYVPFLRALLRDASPDLTWEALARLGEHGITVERADLPAALEVPMVGRLVPTDPESVAAMRATAELGGVASGWALFALGLIGDEPSLSAARARVDDANVFVRFSAAMAFVRLGAADEGKRLLRGLTTAATDDPTDAYRSLAAEQLFRLGATDALPVLIDCIRAREEHADGPIEILEDLTGRYFPTEAEWRSWWTNEGQAMYGGG